MTLRCRRQMHGTRARVNSADGSSRTLRPLRIAIGVVVDPGQPAEVEAGTGTGDGDIGEAGVVDRTGQRATALVGFVAVLGWMEVVGDLNLSRPLALRAVDTAAYAPPCSQPSARGANGTSSRQSRPVPQAGVPSDSLKTTSAVSARRTLSSLSAAP